MSRKRHISPDDLVLYSMQALTPEEQTEAQTHLETCDICRSAVDEACAAASLVGLSAPQYELPEGAQRRFLAAVANTPQITPAPLSVAAPPAEPAHPHKRSLGWLGGLGWVVAVVAILAAYLVGVHNSLLEQQLHTAHEQVAELSAQADRAQDLMDALTSPNAQQITLTMTKHPAASTGHAIYLSQSGTLVFVASNMPPVPAGKTYELWLIPASGKAPIPAGLFRPDAKGNASVVMPKLPSGVAAKAFGVTIEVAQGASTPTLPIVMTGQ